MAEEILMTNNVGRAESTVGSSSSRVTPIVLLFDDEQQDSTVIDIPVDAALTIVNKEDEYEHNPQDAWLPITESRKGSTWTATFHLICSGIGSQTLLLPVAFISIGWVWGIICLSLAFSWQLYTIWLLVDLHETTTTPNIITSTTSTSVIRYSRYLHLSIVAFGEKMGKLVAIFPTTYLASGACTLYIIAGGTTLELLYNEMCGTHNIGCKANTISGSLWFLVFICLAIFIAQFFPNLNSLAWISFLGSITAVAYCTMIWVMSVSKGRPEDVVDHQATVVSDNNNAGFRNVMNGIGYIALAFRGHNLVLEIQGTIPSNRKKPSRKSMWRAVIISYVIIVMCMYPLAIVGHWAYKNKVSANGGILRAFTKFHKNDTSKYAIGVVYIIVIINYLCAFQIYAMPTFDNLQRIYTTKKNKPCPKWLRSAIKLLFGGVAYFISVAFPFLASLGLFIGSTTLPLTLAYPCLMWVAIKKPGRLSKICNLMLGYLGIVLSIVLASAGLWSLIVNGLDANFFKP